MNEESCEGDSEKKGKQTNCVMIGGDQMRNTCLTVPFKIVVTHREWERINKNGIRERNTTQVHKKERDKKVRTMIFPICTSVSLFIIFSPLFSTLLTSTRCVPIHTAVQQHLFSIPSVFRVIDCEKVTRIFFTLYFSPFSFLSDSQSKDFFFHLSLTQSAWFDLGSSHVWTWCSLFFPFSLFLPPTTKSDEQMIFLYHSSFWY